MKTVNNRSCLVAILLEQEKVAAYITFEGEKIGLNFKWCNFRIFLYI